MGCENWMVSTGDTAAGACQIPGYRVPFPRRRQSPPFPWAANKIDVTFIIIVLHGLVSGEVYYS